MLPSHIQTYLSMTRYINSQTMSYHRFQEGVERGGTSGQKRPASPDPVLLVRQYEEDERMAKLLQENETPLPQVSTEHNLHLDDMQGRDSQLQEIFGDEAHMLSESCIMDITSQERIINSLAEPTTSESESRIERDEARLIDLDDEDEEDADEEDADEEDYDEEDYDEDGEFEDDEYADEDGDITTSEEIEAGSCECPRGLQSSEIKRLPTSRIHSSSPPKKKKQSRQGESSSSRRACQVCLERYSPGDKLRYLPCFHEYHKSCIDPWLKKNNTCPVCRVKVDLKELE